MYEVLNTFVARQQGSPHYARGGLRKGLFATGAEGLWWPDHVPRVGVERISLVRGARRGGGTPVSLPALSKNGESRTNGVYHSSQSGRTEAEGSRYPLQQTLEEEED